MPNHLISLLILFSCSWVFAQEQINTDLAHHPHWLKLLHYSSRLLGPARSDITSKDYFLASDGETNPKAELVKTVQGLKESEEIYCRFPSRRMWLEKQGYTFPTRSCAEFEQWTRNHSVQSVSLIFATGFLGNPASYFGHPLMKFNFKDERSPLDLLDTAINYGAFTPPDVGPLPYAIKGIFGGYDAGFTSADFFFHKNNYSELELRNMWEYELSLTSDQVTELVAHLWDLRGAKITYYFFRDNCAFRMSDLLELILDKQFNTAGIPYAIPSTLFHRLHDLKLVKDIRIIKSRQARLREKVLSLTEEEKDLLKMITEDVGRIQSEEFKSVSNDEKSRVLEVAIDYFAYQLILDKAEAAKESKRKLLQARVALPPKTHD